jgi:prophage regulatory protein
MNPSSRPQAIEPLPELLRLPAVLKVTGLSRSTIYRMIAEHTFPAPVRLGRRAVAWRYEDVRQWMIARPTQPKWLQLPVNSPPKMAAMS